MSTADLTDLFMGGAAGIAAAAIPELAVIAIICWAQGRRYRPRHRRDQ